MQSPIELKFLEILRGAFAFFLICMMLAAATSYSMAGDIPTSILFAVCGMAQMMLYVAFPARSGCRYPRSNDPSIAQQAQSCATDFPAGPAKPPEVVPKVGKQ